MIEATFTVSEEEYIDMQKAHLRTQRRKILGQRTWLICLSCVGIYASYELAKHSTVDLYFLLAAYPSFAILLGVIRGIFSSAKLRAGSRLASPQISDMHVQIDDISYRLEVANQKSEMIYWRGFTSWLESPQVIVLRRGQLMYPIPKSALNTMQLAELRELCSHHLARS